MKEVEDCVWAADCINPNGMRRRVVGKGRRNPRRKSIVEESEGSPTDKTTGDQSTPVVSVLATGRAEIVRDFGLGTYHVKTAR